MPVVIALLRAVNVGGTSIIKMADLRTLFEKLKFQDVQTYIQSGNIVFRTKEEDLDKLAKKVQTAIEKRFKAKPDIILRTTNELRSVVARNPFAKRRDFEPNKLHVYFLPIELGKAQNRQLSEMVLDVEELVPGGKELFIYFPNGAGKTKLSWSKLEKICGAPGTGRNWNTVLKILAMAEALEPNA